MNRRRTWLIVIPLVVTAVVTGAGFAVAAASSDDAEAVALGPGDVTVQIDVRHSRFEPDHLTVADGTRIRFLVVNHDPIHHELITGEPEVHLRHADGTEAEHPSVPGEVSVDPKASAITTYTFDAPGTYEFVCHLPGHADYGMRGAIEVISQTP